MQPARLALGLRERLASAPGPGLRGLAASPAARRTLGLRRRDAGGPDPVRLLRPRGRLRRAASGSPFRGRLTVTSSHIAITEPVPDLLEEIGWTGGECITDGRAMVHYLRTTPDGRIAFGWGGGRIACGARLGRRTELDRGVVDQVVSDLRSFFPGLEGRRIAHAWGGPIDVSPSHLPVVVPVGSDRVYGAFGYTGNGVGPSHMLGGPLASLALDRRDEHTRLALVDPDAAPGPDGLGVVAGRQRDPGRAGGQGGRRGEGHHRRPAQQGPGRDPRADRHPHRALTAAIDSTRCDHRADPNRGGSRPPDGHWSWRWCTSGRRSSAFSSPSPTTT